MAELGDGEGEGEGVAAIEGGAVGRLAAVGMGVGVLDEHADTASSAAIPEIRKRHLRDCEI